MTARRTALADWIAPCSATAVVLLALLPSRPSPTGEDVADDAFSTQRALRHVRVIAAEPHPTGSAANDRVCEYLLARLREIGGLEIRDEPIPREDGPNLRNVAARLPGRASTGAVLIGAHYDSAPPAPGAGDNGAAVASALEVLRALRAGAPLRNDVIVLFSDGEELGLLGARAFVASHPWRDDVGLVLNFDARGTAGPTLMYETGPRAGGLVRAFARAVSHPIASSIMAGVYARMPNATDFTVFSAAGYPGLNFAFIGGYRHYHEPTDTVDNLDRATLTHHGTTMLALARRFGDSELPFPSEDEVAYFNPVGAWLVWYPARLHLPLACAVLLLWLATVRAGARGGRVRPTRLGAALAACAVAVAGSAVACGAAAAAGLLLAKGAWWPTGSTSGDGWFFASMAMLAVGVTCSTLRRASRSCSVDELTAGVGAAWVVLLLACCAWLPGAAGQIAWLLAPCLAVLLGAYVAGGNGPRVGLYLAASVPALALMAPLVALFFDAMMLGKAAVPVPLIALTVALLWPVLHRVAGSLARLAFGLGALFWLAGAFA